MLSLYFIFEMCRICSARFNMSLLICTSSEQSVKLVGHFIQIMVLMRFLSLKIDDKKQVKFQVRYKGSVVKQKNEIVQTKETV